jgi:hypothetical protein
MKQSKNLLTLIYGYISFAFVAVLLEIFGVFSPIPGTLAAIWLLIAAYYIGKYGK